MRKLMHTLVLRGARGEILEAFDIEPDDPRDLPWLHEYMNKIAAHSVDIVTTAERREQ